jgi:hypothetical protein
VTLKIIEGGVESSLELRRYLMKKKNNVVSNVPSDNENKTEDVLTVLNFLTDNLHHETNLFRNTVEISNNTKNFMLHLEAVRLNNPVICFFFVAPPTTRKERILFSIYVPK